MATERSLNMVKAVLKAYQPKSCLVGSGGGGHKVTPPNDGEKRGSQEGRPAEYEHANKKVTAEIQESLMISAKFPGDPQDQVKHAKVKSDTLPKLSVYDMNKRGLFRGLVSESIPVICGEEQSSYHIVVSTTNKDAPYVHFIYTIQRPNGETQKLEYNVSLVTTPCRYGGKRFWFKCPLERDGKSCGLRVGVLYLGGNYFGCRHCYNLTYKSRGLSGKFERLGVINMDFVYAAWDPGNWRMYKGKPTKKYNRLLKMNYKFIDAVDILNRVDPKKQKLLEESKRFVEKEMQRKAAAEKYWLDSFRKSALYVSEEKGNLESNEDRKSG